jgi:hypothetical protein
MRGIKKHPQPEPWVMGLESNKYLTSHKDSLAGTNPLERDIIIFNWRVFLTLLLRRLCQRLRQYHPIIGAILILLVANTENDNGDIPM